MRRDPRIVPLFAQPGRLWRFLRDPRAPWLPRLGLVLAILYLLDPIDLIPDVLPFLGWLDDVGALSLAFAWLWRAIVRHEAGQATRETAMTP